MGSSHHKRIVVGAAFRVSTWERSRCSDDCYLASANRTNLHTWLACRMRVRHVAGDMTDLQDGEWDEREWVFLAVNHEVEVEDGLRSSTQAAVLARHEGADLEKLNFRLSPATKAAILNMRGAMVSQGEAPWTILNLKIERSGQSDFSFAYEPPPRLHGDLLHTPPKNLLERYSEDHR